MVRAPRQIAREAILERQAGSQDGTRNLEQRPIHQTLAVRKPNPNETINRGLVRLRGINAHPYMGNDTEMLSGKGE